MPTAPVQKKRHGPALFQTGFLLASLLVLASLAIATPDFDLMAKLAGQRFGMEGRRSILEWRQFLNETSEISEEARLRAVNDFVNLAVTFDTDAAIWGTPDYWATPLETMGRGRGDCEDFTIAKYVSLKLLGVAGEKLRLTYVKARIGGMNGRITQAHMVLSYYSTPTSEPLILDNLIGDIYPASQRTDLYPVFSFSSENLWVGANALPAANATARLSRWRDVLNRMRAEGLNTLFESKRNAAQTN